MKLAIVGASNLSDNQENDARKTIIFIIREYQKELEFTTSLGHIDHLELVTGDAKGIDAIVRDMAEEQNIPCRVFTSKVKQWEGDLLHDGFKERNLRIVAYCDNLVCFASQLRNTPCYHCGTSEHERTGGCWTMKKAKESNKPTRLIVI